MRRRLALTAALTLVVALGAQVRPVGSRRRERPVPGPRVRRRALVGRARRLAERAARRHRGDPARQRLLAARTRRRHLHVRHRALLRLDRLDAPQPAGRRNRGRRRRATATGWSRPTAGSSPSATPASTGRPARCTSTQPIVGMAATRERTRVLARRRRRRHLHVRRRALLRLGRRLLPRRARRRDDHDARAVTVTGSRPPTVTSCTSATHAPSATSLPNRSSGSPATRRATGSGSSPPTARCTRPVRRGTSAAPRAA